MCAPQRGPPCRAGARALRRVEEEEAADVGRAVSVQGGQAELLEQVGDAGGQGGHVQAREGPRAGAGLRGGHGGQPLLQAGQQRVQGREVRV